MLFLVGLPGSGKTTVGRQLARRLGLSFTDSDQVIEEQIGCPIREFFQREGEAAFRDIEESVIEDLAGSHDGVLATGGGAVLRECNRIRLRATGQGFYLHAAPEELHARLRRDTDRPLLQVNDPLQKLRALYAERDPLYRATAHITFETVGRSSIQGLVEEIVARVGG